MEERKGLIRWIKEHKKELLIAGISIGALILIVLGIKNKDEIMALWNTLRKVPKQPTVNVTETVRKVTTEYPIEPVQPVQDVFDAVSSKSDSLPFEVSRHIRNLPEGWHASPEKIAEALENNIILMDGQTWVERYMKGEAAA